MRHFAARDGLIGRRRIRVSRQRSKFGKTAGCDGEQRPIALGPPPGRTVRRPASTFRAKPPRHQVPSGSSGVASSAPMSLSSDVPAMWQSCLQIGDDQHRELHAVDPTFAAFFAPWRLCARPVVGPAMPAKARRRFAYRRCGTSTRGRHPHGWIAPKTATRPRAQPLPKPPVVAVDTARAATVPACASPAPPPPAITANGHLSAGDTSPIASALGSDLAFCLLSPHVRRNCLDTRAASWAI